MTFLGQGILVALVWWLLPGGFPFSHIKFWSNKVALPILAAAMFVGCYADVRNRELWIALLAWATSVLWLTGGALAVALFPASLLGRGFLAALLGVLGLLLATRLPVPTEAGPWRMRGLSAAPAVLLAFILVFAQRAPEPGTHPSNLALLELQAGSAGADWRMDGPQTGSASISLLTQRIDLDRAGYRLAVEPLLTFESRSVDRGWTLFARHEDRRGPPRELLGVRHEPGRFSADFGASEPARMSIASGEGFVGVMVEGLVELPQPVCSHLNGYATLFLTGHSRLELEFSPCPGEWIEPVPHEYPFGLPLRLATRFEDGKFRVVQAANAEKGPYRTLAEGRLGAGDPLTIVLRDAGRPIVSLRFYDWSAQASTDLSPTAGWGLPQNEILFARQDANPASPVFVGLTLASTSTGRGFESVGHAPGVYRNRLRIEWLTPSD